MNQIATFFVKCFSFFEIFSDKNLQIARNVMLSWNVVSTLFCQFPRSFISRPNNNSHEKILALFSVFSTFLKSEMIYGYHEIVTNALCSRNFQNVKLRLDFIEIWLFYCQSDFTWNHILVHSNGPKCCFWPF